jgi:hypothetical protein
VSPQCKVLEFDGENDSIFQEFDQTGKSFMEYLEDYRLLMKYPPPYMFNYYNNIPYN